MDMIFRGSSLYDSRRHLKAVEREVNLAESPITLKPSRWSETVISFSKEDCPIPLTRPGRFPIVVEPIINNCKVNRVLIHGDSSLNILFTSALEEMQIPRSKVKPVKYAFHDIVPGPAAKLIGQLSLPVMFGRTNNFRIESIPFDVIDFETAYNGIFGRPAIAKFLIAMHYGYQSLKMIGPKGVITVRGDRKIAYACHRKFLELVDELPTRETNLSLVHVTHSRPKMAPKPSD